MPVGPVAPVMPVSPVGPVGPVDPVEPVDPAPVCPVMPVGPVSPVGPVPEEPAPVGPVTPVGPVAPVVPVTPPVGIGGTRAVPWPEVPVLSLTVILVRSILAELLSRRQATRARLSGNLISPLCQSVFMVAEKALLTFLIWMKGPMGLVSGMFTAVLNWNPPFT